MMAVPICYGLKPRHNNSPSFNWTLNLRKQVREDWIESGKINAGDYPDNTQLMSAAYDEDALGLEADARLQAFQTDIAREAGVHQHEVGSNLGDDFKEMTGGERALKAGGEHNTMNQFENAA